MLEQLRWREKREAVVLGLVWMIHSARHRMEYKCSPSELSDIRCMHQQCVDAGERSSPLLPVLNRGAFRLKQAETSTWRY
jgi:hypothetical protein